MLPYHIWDEDNALKGVSSLLFQPIQLRPVPQAMAFKYHEEEWPGRPSNCCRTWPVKKTWSFCPFFFEMDCMFDIYSYMYIILGYKTWLGSWKHMFFLIIINHWLQSERFGMLKKIRLISEILHHLSCVQPNKMMGGINNYQLVQDVNHRQYSTVWLAWLCWHGMLQTKHLAAPAK